MKLDKFILIKNSFSIFIYNLSTDIIHQKRPRSPPRKFAIKLINDYNILMKTEKIATKTTFSFTKKKKKKKRISFSLAKFTFVKRETFFLRDITSVSFNRYVNSFCESY